MTPFGKSIVENGFTTMVKYLTFAACAARAPVTQSLTKEINERVLIAGSPENIERWMFWTVPQATFFANATSQQKVLLLGGNGVGKKILMIERAKQLAIKGEEVVFCVYPPYSFGQKLLLQLQLEIQFEEFYKENPTSRKIRVENLYLYDPSKEHLSNTHMFIDELNSIKFHNFATLKAKSLWVVVNFDHALPYTHSTCLATKFKKANEAINFFKVQYPDWYIPFFNFILRTTQNIAEKLKDGFSAFSIWNNESSLNHVVDITQNIQEGPKPLKFKFETSEQFCKNVLSTFKELVKNDSALILLDCHYSMGPVHSMSSKAINDFKTNFPKYSNLIDLRQLTLAFLVKCMTALGRKHPLIWLERLNDKNLNSNEVQIKDWIRGKSKCDLIVDR